MTLEETIRQEIGKVQQKRADLGVELGKLRGALKVLTGKAVPAKTARKAKKAKASKSTLQKIKTTGGL